MAKKDNSIIIYLDKNGKRRSKNHFILVFIAILAFIAIFMPMFGTTLRYQASYLFQEIFNTIGSLTKLAGMVLIAFGFLSIFIGKRIKVGAFLFGLILLWIGCFLTYTPFTLFGFNFGGSQPPIGYH
jgi:hypothetical protein